jgi:uncharacterized protein with GYD domain
MQIRKKGSNLLASTGTPGKYDAVAVYEAPRKKAAMKAAIAPADLMERETLVAVLREEGKNLV